MTLPLPSISNPTPPSKKSSESFVKTLGQGRRWGVWKKAGNSRTHYWRHQGERWMARCGLVAARVIEVQPSPELPACGKCERGQP